jgi:hypothetical protein
MIISMESEQGGLNMPKKEDTKQTTFLWWDGKQMPLKKFMSELFDDPDEDDQDWETVYKKNRVE